MCAAALVQSRIKRVVFAARDPKGGGIVSLMNLGSDARLNHQFEISEGLFADESSQMLKNFFQKKRQNKIKS